MTSDNLDKAARDLSALGEWYMPSSIPNGRAALVLHEAPGITANVKRRCATLAAMGYIAFAPQLHRVSHSLTRNEANRAVTNLQNDPEQMRRLVKQNLEHLCQVAGVSPTNVAVIGYCFGGMAALELARSGEKVAAVLSFHGLLSTKLPAQTGKVSAPILICTGGLDELVPIQDVMSFHQEMTRAEARWEMIIYGHAKHSFTNLDANTFGDRRMRHDAYSDEKSWSAALAFLATAYA
ncbi:dienelactone hydrolase family protein [Herbaspirillum rubrisubalbicans]|uniref:Dienelactone hydrolase family protein n=1 Tax=Herbaspirillum rubrisubalbicans TaxID=80842 RepID=A0AAD0U930_9BURK|nr:dienelactone hydrolase family protein [Herbaspirillum rubrisubalbicans]AYR23395.1 dienelactone hydrolase family protein [Herbaspirillum rubrisubalbicans]